MTPTKTLLVISTVPDPPIEQAILKHDLLSFTRLAYIEKDPASATIRQVATHLSMGSIDYTMHAAYAMSDATLVFWELGEDKIPIEIIKHCNLKDIPCYIEFLEPLDLNPEASKTNKFLDEQEKKFMKEFNTI